MSHANADSPSLSPPSKPDAARAKSDKGLIVSWARSASEVLEAQRLRYRVFAQEMGARLETPLAGHDIDHFDPYCEHLLVRDADEGEVIGTYRVLTPTRARAAGGYYSDGEFDLSALEGLRGRMVELGRSCVDERHRQGGVILALWGALATFMEERGLDVMIGCASIPMRDGGHSAASLWRQLSARHLAEAPLRARPLLALPVDELDAGNQPVQPPPLVKGYLRLGAKLLGPPAWDPDFNTADLPMIFSVGDLQSRHRRHFLGGPALA
jgi:putative hemolysin